LSRAQDRRESRIRAGGWTTLGSFRGSWILAAVWSHVMRIGVSVSYGRGARSARVPRAALEAGSPVRLDPLVHGLPRPAQRVVRHLLRREDDRQPAGVGERRLRRGTGSRARHARHEEAHGELRLGRGDHADRRRLRPGGVGRPLRGGDAQCPGSPEEQAGRDALAVRRRPGPRAPAGGRPWTR